MGESPALGREANARPRNDNAHAVFPVGAVISSTGLLYLICTKIQLGFGVGSRIFFSELRFDVHRAMQHPNDTHQTGLLEEKHDVVAIGA